MDIWNADKLALFIAFVIPGFVSLKTYQLLFPTANENSTSQLVDAIAFSSINYAILLIPIVLVEESGAESARPFLYYLFYLVVLFGAPVGWALLWRYLRTREWFQRHAPHPVSKPWDYLFAQRKPYWAKITLKDGSIIGGKSAGKSFASSAPATEQLYLEETWVLGKKGAFKRKKNETEGVLVVSDEISHIELRELRY